MNGSLGFMRALQLLLRVEDLGLTTLAIPCNSFGYMSSSQHARTWENPMGAQTFSFVIIGNQVCCRACMLLALAIVRTVFFLWRTLSARHCQSFLTFASCKACLGYIELSGGVAVKVVGLGKTNIYNIIYSLYSLWFQVPPNCALGLYDFKGIHREYSFII